MKKSDLTKQIILDAGVKLWPDVTARAIARKINMTHPTIAYQFGDNASLKNAVAEYAVETGNSRVIAQLIAIKHKSVKNMSAGERAKHMKAVS